MSINIPTICLTNIGPLITLSVAGLLLLLIDAFSIKGAKKGYFHQLSLVAIIIGIIQTIFLWNRQGPILRHGLCGQLFLLLLYGLFNRHRYQHHSLGEISGRIIRKIMANIML